MKVMVSISTKREGSPWSGERTLTIDQPEASVRDAWLAAFPGLLDRALRTPDMAVQEATIDDDDGDQE